MTDFDSPWKLALEDYFEPFIALFFPEMHAEIDWSRESESLDNELQQITPKGEVGRRVVDKLVKVWLRDGDEQWVLIHVEVQTSEEAEFARRMYVYNFRLFDRYNKDVVSLAVLGDENTRWRPDRFVRSRWRCSTEFHFPVVKLLDYERRREELESSRNLFATVVLAHLDTLATRADPETRRDLKIRLVKGLHQRGWSGEEVWKLFVVIDWLLQLPDEMDEEFWQVIRTYEEDEGMPYLTTPERIGRRQGLEEGRSEGLRKGIETALRTKFGDEGARLSSEIGELSGEQKLIEILELVLRTDSLDELRRVWPPPSGDDG